MSCACCRRPPRAECDKSERATQMTEKKRWDDTSVLSFSQPSVPVLSAHLSPSLPLFISHSFSAATICYPLAYLAATHTHTHTPASPPLSLSFYYCTSRASSARQGEGHLHSTSLSSSYTSLQLHTERSRNRLNTSKKTRKLSWCRFNITLFAFCLPLLSTSSFLFLM